MSSKYLHFFIFISFQVILTFKGALIHYLWVYGN